MSFLNIKKLEETIRDEKIKELEYRLAVLETTVATQGAMISAIQTTANEALAAWLPKQKESHAAMRKISDASVSGAFVKV